MIILGLNAFHADSAAALVRDGELVAAAEEERFRRIKHWAGFPSQAIAYCLREAGVRLSDVDHVAFNQDSRANLLRKIGYFLTKRPNLGLVLQRLRNRRSPRRDSRACWQGVPGSSLARRDSPGGASSGAPVLGVSRLSVRRGGRGVGRWLRRFLQRGLGRGNGIRDIDRWPSIFPAFARHLLPGADPVSRLSALWRRVQGDGAGALRQAVVHWTPCARSSDLLPDGGFELDLAYFRHHREDVPTSGQTDRRSSATCSRQRSRSCLGPRRAADRSARGSASRHRPLGAGDVRGGVFPPSRRRADDAPA